ncbi:MAG: hypothetical protein QOJ45_274 [Verrucomicrobiota bacterium]|jgi:hypothetical protein
MTTTVQIIRYLEKALFYPVLASGNPLNRRRVRFARMCLGRLPPQSAILYCIHGGAGIEPNRVACNADLERDGFRSFGDLLPDLERRFPDVWPRL